MKDLRRLGVDPASTPIGAVDVFCGAGGLSLGLKWSAVRIAAGIDLDPICKFPFEKGVGAKFINRDVEEVSGRALKRLYHKNEVRLLAGCAPCQPFSQYNARLQPTEGRWNLLLHFLRLVREVRPELVTLENVPGLARQQIWTDFVEALTNAKYQVAWSVLDAADYGVAQARRRLVLMASRLGPISLPAKFGDRRTVRSEIGHLPKVEAGTCWPGDRLHVARGMTSRNLHRIRESTPGGSWKSWHEELRAICHRSSGGRTFGSVYGRMSWDEPAPTMTTQFYGFGNGRFGHPEQDRALTVREGAMLQSFPPDYEFVEHNERVSIRAVGRLIGNAVPPLLGAAIGLSFKAHLTQ